MKLILLSIFSLLIISSILCVKINKIERFFLKEGLHRDLRTNITFLVEKPSELECSFVIKENISNEFYIYLEEVIVLKKFEFWPHEAMDVEKPSSAA
jgi:hypothetical protein